MKAPGWLNRTVAGIGTADLAADANYEMVFAVLPLFITVGLGGPAFAVGLVEGLADGSSAVVKLWSGWYSDRIAWRKRLAVGDMGPRSSAWDCSSRSRAGPRSSSRAPSRGWDAASASRSAAPCWPAPSARATL